MATVYAKINDQAAPVSQDPSEVGVNVGAVLGLLGSASGSSGDAGGTVILPLFGGAGAIATVDDAVYVDAGDGTVGTASRFFPGSGAAKGYANEKSIDIGALVDNDTNYRAALEPVGATPDIQTVMGIS